MSDYPVKPLSDEQVKQLAKRLRESFGVAGDRRVDVIACAERRSIWTVNGERELRLQLRSDHEIGPDYGLTIYESNCIIIAVKRSIRHSAYMGDGYARNTFAHEFGHAVMHDGAPKARRALGNAHYNFIKPFEICGTPSQELRSSVFDKRRGSGQAYSSAEEISVEFGISLESAKIYFRQLTARRNRGESNENVRRIAEEVRAILSPPKRMPTVTFLPEPCSVCRNATVFPIGHKFVCQTCDTVFDRFQDGDIVEF